MISKRLVQFMLAKVSTSGVTGYGPSTITENIQGTGSSDQQRHTIWSKTISSKLLSYELTVNSTLATDITSKKWYLLLDTTQKWYKSVKDNASANSGVIEGPGTTGNTLKVDMQTDSNYGDYLNYSAVITYNTLGNVTIYKTYTHTGKPRSLKSISEKANITIFGVHIDNSRITQDVE